MSVAPRSASVEKALLPTASATSVQPRPSALPSTATATTTTTAAAALAPACAAKVNGVITDDLRQLSRDDLDVTRWLNATLAHVLETARDASAGAETTSRNNSDGTASAKSVARKPLQLEEQLVQLLQARVQTHSQELSAGIEDLISNTLVRLPRTTMELSRMSAEAAEVTGQLQSIEAVVQPAVQAKSDAYVAQLHTCKASEEKLRKCARLLEKAARVEENLRNIQYLVDHREAKAAHPAKDASSSTSAAPTPPSAEAAKAGKDASSSATAATRQRDLDEVAAIIRQAREDLKEITAVDDTFGEQYTAQLEQFEQYIEHALEEECVACLRAHQLERATRLITTLHSIGRANAVLKRYGEQAAAQLTERQAEKLQAAASGNNNGNAKASTAAAAVAELLRTRVIPDDSVFLSQELAFLSSLVRGASAAVAAAEGGAGVAAANTGEKDASSTAASAVKGGAANAKEASTTNNRAVDEDPWAAQVLDVLAVLLTKLHDPVQATLRPLLTERPDTTNSDFVACFTAIQQLKVSASAAAATTVTAAKDPLEKLAREVTHRALTLFASLFQEETVLERYAQRVCTPVSDYCTQPLVKLLGSPASAAVAAASEDGSLAQVLTQAVQEVLLYVPEKISARCTAAWHTQLSKALVQQLQPATTTSQHVLLQHLYLYKQRVKPLLTTAQQVVEDGLSSGTVHERYPTSAGLLRTDLQTRLWSPLKAEVEAAQRATQLSILRGITRPILAKVEAYGALPCWGNRTDAQAESPTAQGSSAAASLSRYTQGQAAPSSAVRDMGEMLMELPLTLETLASTAVAENGDTANRSSGHVAAIAANDADAEEGVRVLIDEQAEDWLETVVRDVVRGFLDDTVLPLQIGPFADAAPPSGDGAASTLDKTVLAQLYAMAVEQLTTDLDYLRNILSAVNEESQETVERVMSAIRALPSAPQGSFVVKEAIEMTTCAATTAEDALEKATESDTRQAGSG